FPIESGVVAILVAEQGRCEQHVIHPGVEDRALIRRATLGVYELERLGPVLLRRRSGGIKVPARNFLRQIRFSIGDAYIRKADLKKNRLAFGKRHERSRLMAACRTRSRHEFVCPGSERGEGVMELENK